MATQGQDGAAGYCRLRRRRQYIGCLRRERQHRRSRRPRICWWQLVQQFGQLESPRSG
jgi:hypothetical protein